MDVVTLGAALAIMKKMPDTAASSAAAAEDAADRAEAAAEQAEGAIEVDDTLSVEGRAADAAETGKIKENLDGITIQNFTKITSRPIDISNYLQQKTLVYLSGTPFSTINFDQNMAYMYYDVPTEGLSKISATGFSGSNVKAIIFTDENNTLIDYFPKESIPSPGQNVDVECTVPNGATRLLLIGNGIGTELFELVPISFEMGDELVASIHAANSFSDLTIENYSRRKESVGTLFENAYYNVSGNAVPINGYEYKTFTDVISGRKLWLSGIGGTGNRLYVTQDKNGNVIDVYPSTSPTAHFSDYEYTVPTDAAKVTVNGSTSDVPLIKTEIANAFVLDEEGLVPIATETSESVYSVGTEAINYTVSLHGSNNKLFNFQTLSYNGINIKTSGDDICPVNIVNCGYVGANHGYVRIYKCTANAHGLSESDIGKTCTYASNTFVLIQVLDANTFVVGCYTDAGWMRLKYVDLQTIVLNFGAELSVTPVLDQLYPSVKDGNVRILENIGNKFSVLETYDIIDVGTGIDAIIANVGNNNNESVAELADSLITIRNIYDFYNNGSVVIHQNLKVLKTTKINFYGGIQSGAFGANDGYAIPQTSLKPITQTDGTTVSFERATWESESVPPSMFIQTNGVGNNMTAVMLLGYIAENRNVSIASTAGVSQGSSRKMYPYLISPGVNIDPGTVYNSISYRVPIFGITSADKVLSSHTFIRNDVYMFVITKEAVNTSVSVPDEAYGKKVTVIISDGVTVNTKDVIDSIDIVSDGEGYLLVKLSV